MKWVIFCAAAASVLAGFPAAAQIDGFRACSKIVNSEQRLACYDAALAAVDSQAAAELEAQRKAAQLAAQQAEAEAKARKAQEQVASFGAEATSAARRAADEEKLETLSAKIVEVFQSASGQVFELDNGHVWRQTESRTLPPIRPGDAVTIKRGTLGSYRMIFERQNRAVSVKRFR